MFSLVAILLLSKHIPFFFNMSIIAELNNHTLWQEFLEHKIAKSHLSRSEEQKLIDYVNNKEYTKIANEIINSTYTFSIPKKSIINKNGSQKKRIVYSFDECENIILKFILFLLYKYDSYFPPNCYSFRKNHTVKKALAHIINTREISQMYAYKVDISNYFNSINVEILLVQLKEILNEDTQLFNLIRQILITNKCVHEDMIIDENRGAIAGMPLSAFFANLYLRDMDEYFHKNNILYIRYSDDIIVFSKSREELEKHRQYILDNLEHMKLSLNPDKEQFFAIGEGWNFLGFEYKDGKIDISRVALKKIKDKIRRKARALYRWKVKNDKSTEHTINVMLRVFNNKFFREKNTKDLSWSKWYFPVLTTHKTLKEIDSYLLQYIRYLDSGRFTKKNYNIKYNYLKSLGYQSLVNEFYRANKKDHK